MIEGRPPQTWWPAGPEALAGLQSRLGERATDDWRPADVGCLAVASVFVACPTGRPGPGSAGEPCWAAAVLWRTGDVRHQVTVGGQTGAPYAAGLLALRYGALLARAVLALEQQPDLLLVDATGRDHPRRAGLALHLGAALEVPSVGVTNRALLAAAAEPGPQRGDCAPLTIDGELVGYAVRTREGTLPVLAHAAWRTSADTARAVTLALAARWRTPEPLRRARTLARVARAADEGRSLG